MAQYFIALGNELRESDKSFVDCNLEALKRLSADRITKDEDLRELHEIVALSKKLDIVVSNTIEIPQSSHIVIPFEKSFL